MLILNKMFTLQNYDKIYKNKNINHPINTGEIKFQKNNKWKNKQSKHDNQNTNWWKGGQWE